MKHLPQIRLRTLFLFFFCAATGLTCATVPSKPVDPALGPFVTPQLNFYYAFFYSASTAIVVGLIAEARSLTKWNRATPTHDNKIRFARTLAIAWRIGVASMLTACLMAHLLIEREILKLPDHDDLPPGDIFPEAMATILLVFVLVQSLARWRQTSTQISDTRWRAAFSAIAGLLLALLVLPDAGMVQWLIHIAISGIEVFQPGKLQRPGAYPDPRAEGFRFFWLSLGAVAALAASAAILVAANYGRSFKRHLAVCSVAIIVLLTLDVIFCAWYYAREFHRISIDMASVRLAANWFDWACCGVLILFLAGVAAYRLSIVDDTGAEKVVTIPAPGRVPANESLWCLFLLLAAMISYYIDAIRLYFDMPNFFAASRGILQFVASVLCYASGYITLGILVVTIQLIWKRWRRHTPIPDLQLWPVSPRRFFLNYVAMALLIAVSVPTVAIYCFAFWFGPWYLYGD